MVPPGITCFLGPSDEIEPLPRCFMGEHCVDVNECVGLDRQIYGRVPMDCSERGLFGLQYSVFTISVVRIYDWVKNIYGAATKTDGSILG